MIVLDPPLRLKLAASTLLLSAPLAAIEVALARHSPWWHLPWTAMGTWALGFLIISIPMAYWMITGKRWAIKVLLSFLTLWILTSLLLASKDGPTLGFFALLIAALSTMVVLWIQIELGRSFIDPKMSWFEGLPQSIPGLTCRFANEPNLTTRLQVSRLDLDGTFIFVPYSQLNQARPALTAGPVQLIFEMKTHSHSLSCTGQPVAQLANGFGMGLSFIEMTSDSKKQISDFVELLRGNGYV